MNVIPNVTCTVCGENDFHLKEGYYYCNECGTKSEQVRALEVERDDEFEDVKHKKTLKIKAEKSNKPELTSWECYNYILRGIVEELLDLGAKDELKTVVLQIWAAYLRNMEVAFFSRKHADLPKLGVRFEPRDASILYNHCIERKKAKREEKKNSSIAGSRREWRKQMKKFDQSQYEASMSESICSQSVMSQSSFGNTSGNSSGSVPSNRAICLKFSKKARKQLKKKMHAPHLKKHEQDFNQSLTCHKVRIKSSECKHTDLTMELKMKQLYAIISIALNLIEDDIQLTDLIRFINEGHISCLQVSQFFPENISEHCKGTLASLRFHMKSMQFSVSNMREKISLLCKAVHIRQLKTPDISKLVKRYITELCLPVEMYTFIERLINLYPPKMNWDNRTSTPCYESRAMAYIIFTLKLLFGLDGRKEKEISRSVKKVNVQLATMHLKNYVELFVWDDWVEYIETRLVILCNCSLPTCKQFKQTPRREVYLQHMSERCKFTEKAVTKEQKKKQQNMEIVFENFLQYNNNVKQNALGQIKFTPSYTPSYNNFRRIQLDPIINKTIPGIMGIDHSKRLLMPLLKPSELKETFAKCDRKLNVIRICCTSRQNATGTFRNPLLNNCSTLPRKVHIDNDQNAWEAKVKEEKPADSIFKPVMEQYSVYSLKTMQKTYQNKIDIAEQMDTGISVDIKFNNSSDIFEENGIEPAESIIKLPRRNLERVNIFAEVSDNEDFDTQDQSQEDSLIHDPGTTTLKISNMDCWLLMGKASDLTELQSAELKSKLPLTFFWLLETCANTLGVDWTELYDELMVLETFFAHDIESLNQFEDRIIFKEKNKIKDINKIVRHFQGYW